MKILTEPQLKRYSDSFFMLNVNLEINGKSNTDQFLIFKRVQTIWHFFSKKVIIYGFQRRKCKNILYFNYIIILIMFISKYLECLDPSVSCSKRTVSFSVKLYIYQSVKKWQRSNVQLKIFIRFSTTLWKPFWLCSRRPWQMANGKFKNSRWNVLSWKTS